MDENYKEMSSKNLELQANIEELYRELNSLKQINFQEKLEEESKEKAFNDEIKSLRGQIETFKVFLKN
jgi:hypothetical protein